MDVCEMSDDVVAVLAETDHIDLPVEDCQAHHVCVLEARRHLAALTAAGYAIVKLPEGVAVAHGHRGHAMIPKIDTRPRCESLGDYLGDDVPCDLHEGHEGKHRWGMPMSFEEFEWTDTRRQVSAAK